MFSSLESSKSFIVTQNIKILKYLLDDRVVYY